MDLKKYFSSKFENPETPKILIGGSVLIAIFFLALKTPNDPDLFWHLKSGELMWQYGVVPHIDWFSFSAGDYAWINFEWMSEILMFAIWKIAGFGGLAVFFASLITITFGYLIPQSIKDRPFFVTQFLMIIGTLISSLTFGSRPLAFSLAGTALIFFIITKYKAGCLRTVWLFPPLFLLWANLHGGFVLGLGLLAVFILLENFLIKQKERNPAAEWLKSYSPLPREKWKKLLYSFTASVGMTFLNPYGWRLYQEVYRAIADNYDKNYIEAWLAPNFHTNEGLIFGFYVIFSFIILATIKKIDLLSFVLIPIALFFAFQSARNIPIFVIISLPFLVKSLMEFENIFSEMFQKRFAAVAISAFLIVQPPVQAKTADIIKTFGSSAALAESGNYPNKALKFLLDNPNLSGKNIFNDYGWGGYIVSNVKCSPFAEASEDKQIPNAKEKELDCKPKVFIDGRMSYWKTPDGYILKDYLDIYNFSDNWNELIDKYRIQIIFIDKKISLAKILKLNNNWINIYEDDLAVIYEKK